jgi:mono/diheme cytochrome c family protein
MRAALLIVWAGALVTRPVAGQILSPFAREKAGTLLATRLPCLGCHRLDGRGGAIGPDLSAVGARLSRDAIEAMITDPQGTRPGSLMPRVPMPVSTRLLITAYLAERREATAGAPRQPPSPARPPAGETRSPEPAYARHCAACHGDQGRGDGWNAAALAVRPATLADAARMSALSDDRLFDTIHAGGYVMNRSPFMPPFGLTLTREEIRALVRHIRTLCRCQGPAWSR